MLEQLDTQYAKKKKMYLDYISRLTKLKMFHKYVRLLKEDKGEYLCDCDLGNEFLSMKPKSCSVKEKKKINWASSKFKTFALPKTLLKE